MNLNKNEKEFLVRFGLELKRIRESRGWSQEFAANQGLSSRQHLTDIEAGKRKFNIFTLLKLTQIYGSIVITLAESISEDLEF